MKENVKFGFDQITNKTPQFAKWAFRFVLYLAAITNIILSTITEIPEDVRVLISKYSVYGITLVHAFSKLFGIEVEGPNASRNNLKSFILLPLILFSSSLFAQSKINLDSLAKKSEARTFAQFKGQFQTADLPLNYNFGGIACAVMHKPGDRCDYFNRIVPNTDSIDWGLVRFSLIPSSSKVLYLDSNGVIQFDSTSICMHEWEEYKEIDNSNRAVPAIYQPIAKEPLPVYKRKCTKCNKTQEGKPLIIYE